MIDGHWGQYATARLVEIAAGYGYPGEADQADAKAILHEMAYPGSGDAAVQLIVSGLPAEPAPHDDPWEHIIDAADSAEAWLNDNIAAEGHAFGWHDGEFFYMPNEWWDE
jgi:hypothetical protein